MNRLSRLSTRLAAAMVRTGALVVVVVLAFILGPFIEGKALPVLTDMKAQVKQLDAERMTVRITGVKRRSCDYPQEISATVYDGREWIVADVRTATTVIDPTGRPEGLQTFRPLVITPPGHALRLSFVYRCHPLWETRFTLPDLPLAPAGQAVSHAYYATRLYWVAGRGVAKLHGHCVPLTESPRIAGAPIEGIDYTPEVAVFRIQRPYDGWTDMSAGDIADADRLLYLITAHAQQPEKDRENGSGI